MANETKRERLKSSTLPLVRPYVYDFDGLVSSEHVSHGWGGEFYSTVLKYCPTHIPAVKI
jgi:hypothetical protein